MERGEVLKTLAHYRKDEIVLYTMSSFKEGFQYFNGPLDFYVGGAMGFASSIGLGLALAQPRRRVWVVDGDGSLLMNLGTLVTIAEQAPGNLVHFVMENGVYEIPGRVPIPGVGRASLLGFARAAGLTKAYEYDEMARFSKHVGSLITEPGPVFVNLKVAPGPRQPVDKEGKMRGSAEMARAMEQALSGAKV